MENRGFAAVNSFQRKDLLLNLMKMCAWAVPCALLCACSSLGQEKPQPITFALQRVEGSGGYKLFYAKSGEIPFATETGKLAFRELAKGRFEIALDSKKYETELVNNVRQVSIPTLTGPYTLRVSTNSSHTVLYSGTMLQGVDTALNIQVFDETLNGAFTDTDDVLILGRSVHMLGEPFLYEGNFYAPKIVGDALYLYPYDEPLARLSFDTGDAADSVFVRVLKENATTEDLYRTTPQPSDVCVSKPGTYRLVYYVRKASGTTSVVTRNRVELHEGDNAFVCRPPQTARLEFDRSSSNDAVRIKTAFLVNDSGETFTLSREIAPKVEITWIVDGSRRIEAATMSYG